MAYTYTLLTDRARAGPLVQELNSSTFYALLANPANVYSLVNQQARQAEESLPEGTRVELVLTGLYNAAGIPPSELARRVNLAYLEGKITDPQTGEMLRHWPEHANVIAWADDGSGRLTLRWLKGVAWVWVVLMVLLSILAIYAIYVMLHQANWSLSKADTSGGGGGGGGVPAPRIWGLSIWWWVGGVAALALAPYVISQAAKIVRARRELERAEQGLPPAPY